jgi:hypothetical protein
LAEPKAFTREQIAFEEQVLPSTADLRRESPDDWRAAQRAELHADMLAYLLTRAIPADWRPDAEHINALPEPLRAYVFDLETRVDPAGDLRARRVAEDTVRALEARVQELEAELAAKRHGSDGRR